MCTVLALMTSARVCWGELRFSKNDSSTSAVWSEGVGGGICAPLFSWASENEEDCLLAFGERSGVIDAARGVASVGVLRAEGRREVRRSMERVWSVVEGIR